MDSDREKALHKALDKIVADAYDKPMSVRVEIGNRLICLMGSKWFDPSTLYFEELPQVVAEKIVLLKMLNNFQRLEGIGKKYNDTMFYVFITPNQWQQFKDEAVPMLR